MDEPLSADTAHAKAAPLRTGLRLLVPVLLVTLALLLLAAGVGGSVRWLLATDAGSRWLIRHLPFVQSQGYSGALWGDSWRAERLRIQWADGQQWLEIEGLAADGLRWHWRPNERAWIGLDVKRMVLRKLTLHTGGPKPGALTLPAELAPPLQLNVADTQVAEFVLDALPPVRQIALRDVTIDASQGGHHRIEQLAFDGFGVSVAGQASIANTMPYALAATTAVRPSGEGDAPRWAAALQVGGSLAEQVELSGKLRGRPLAGRAAPQLDLRAGLRPLQPWVLAHLEVRTQALDLSALHLRAPATQLSGHATLQGGAGGTPMTAQVKLDNAAPGRWNEARLPLRTIALELRGQLQQRDRLDIHRFEIALGDATRSAGTLGGSAVWLGHELKLDLLLQSVAPQRLDGRAAAMTMSGPMQATLRGVPSPDAAAKTTAPPPSLAWKLDLEGRLDAAPRTVRLAMEGNANDQQLELNRLHASSGGANANLHAVLKRSGKADWRLDSAGSLVDFDPLPWWPGEAGGAWRQGPHRISAGWEFELRLPAQAASLTPLELAQRLAGNGNLRVHDSVFAGVPLSAEVKIGYTQAAAPTPALLHAQVLLGGNQIVVAGKGDPGGAGLADRWSVELRGDNLGSLAPLTRLHAALADWLPRRGTARLSAAAEGRWPRVAAEGSARVAQLQMGKLTLAQGLANWRIDNAGERPLSLRLELAGLQLGAQRADHLRADVSGTLAEHRIEISGALPLLPPELAVKVLGAQSQSGTQAQMQARGTWQADPAGGGLWRARVERLVVGSWDGGAADSAPASVWARARDLRAELQFDGAARLLALRADAGRVEFSDSMALRWDEVKIDLRGALAQIELHADIEPFPLVPLLARLQPTVGWSGDIRLTARVDIRAAERFEADLVFERHDGDLHIASDEGMQLLGLTELRLAVTAREGLWTLTPAFKGRSLGEVAGSVRVQTTAERRWPPDTAALDGQLQVRVADVGIWGGWVPPGWRLAGELRASATLGGTVADPRFTGELSGTGLSVRNLLQGVNVTDGQLAVRLQGDKASIERFSLRGGDGKLELSGNATLGASPKALLQLKAERFRAIGRVDRMLIASGQAELEFGGETTRLDGRFRLDEGLFDASRGDAPTLDNDVTVRRGSEAETAADDKRPATVRRNVAVRVEVDLGDKMRVRGRGLDTGLAGSVRLSTPGGRLDVRGTIHADDGTYAAYGQKLVIERGIVAFGGPPDDPRLDILALRPNIDTRVGVAIAGTLQSPRVRLFSDPDMSDTEKLSWLVLGRAPDGLGRTDTALLQRAAVALLSGEGEAPTDALMRNLGIDELSLRQGEGEVRETVITLGKQLSRRWYLGYERGVNATTGTWQLIYRIAQRFTLRAQSGLENSLDVIWTWRLQETPADAGMRKSIVRPP